MRITILCILILFSAYKSLAQNGGAPMMTDEPGTVPARKLELNSAILSEIGKYQEFQIPVLDFNYGLNERLQLKFEMPFVLSNKSDTWTTSFSNPFAGIKFRMLDAKNQNLAISFFPHVRFALNKGEMHEIKLPVQFAFRKGEFVINEEIGYMSPDNLFNGLLIGRRVNENFELMGEIYTVLGDTHFSFLETMLNCGFRYSLSEIASLIFSVGTDLYNKSEEDRKYIFTYTGIQWIL